MPGKNALLQLSRKIHLYFGLFISPALLFFAVTGAYQTLGLHEPSSNYKPPTVLAELAQIHKKQTNVTQVRRTGGPEGAGRPDSNRVTEKSTEVGAETEGKGGPGDVSSHGKHSQNGSERFRGAASSFLTGAAQTPGGPATGGSGPGPGGGRPPQTLQAKQKQHLPLKIFFVVVSFGLLLSTLTGTYMAYRYERNKLLVTGLLIAGVVIPLLLLRF